MCSETAITTALKWGDSCKLCIASKLQGLVLPYTVCFFYCPPDFLYPRFFKAETVLLARS